jgi:hypothetical protein
VVTALFILIWLAGIGFSLYLITQLSANGLNRTARSARTRAIVWGFFPFWGVEIVVQLYYYSKIRRAMDSQTRMSKVQPTFRAPTASPQGFVDGPSAPASSSQGQQKRNPFL